jgi:hypothetical protein
MPEIVLHFDTAPGANAEALTTELRSELAALPDVESSDAQALAPRDFGATAAVVMGFLTVAPIAINKAADLIDAIKRLVESSEGLRNAIIEISGRKVPVAQLKPSDLASASPQS